MTAGTDAYVAGKFVEAARQFQQAVALQPDSDQAQFWAGQAMVYGRQPAAAISYLETAQRQGVKSIALHLALVAAYAGAGSPADRDRERELLHKWHSDGEHPSLTHAEGFLLETFYTHQWHVNVFEYFGPVEGDDCIWKFTVRDPAEVIESRFFLEAKGGGKYELLRFSGKPEDDSSGKRVKDFDSLPDYDAVKQDVAHKLRFALPDDHERIHWNP